MTGMAAYEEDSSTVPLEANPKSVEIVRFGAQVAVRLRRQAPAAAWRRYGAAEGPCWKALPCTPATAMVEAAATTGCGDGAARSGSVVATTHTLRVMERSPSHGWHHTRGL
jgi:hypothetical protein